MSLRANAWVGVPVTVTATRRRGRGWLAHLITGLLVLLFGFLAWREFEPLLLFRRVDGVVVWSEVARTPVAGSTARHRTNYDAQVTYRYEVNGESFLSAQYRRTNTNQSFSAATRRVRRHILGARVPAWYNPLDPAEAVLSRAPNWKWLTILGGVMFMVWLFSLLVTANPGRPAAPRRR